MKPSTDSDSKVFIIGMGSDGLSGLTARARDILSTADVVIGTAELLESIKELSCVKLCVGNDVQETVRAVEAQGPEKRIAVLASGDPLFYGVARYLCDRLGEERFEVLPHVSSMQLAFARVKESWEEAFLTNLASHPLETVLDRIRVAETVGLFTSDRDDPRKVARELLARGLDYFHAYVCENLGTPNERVTQGELTDIVEMEFSPLNVMILKRKPGHPGRRAGTVGYRLFGNPDDVFAQSRPKSGLITQEEVRAIALARLNIQPGSVVWDIGAGSGAVAIEAAQLANPGIVYAIEQDVADYHLIEANAETFHVKNVRAILGRAPAVFQGLPAPDAIFIGGTGKDTAGLLSAAFAALLPGGRLVANVATLESLNATYATLKSLAPPVQVLLVNVARGTEQLETLRFEANNPTFLLNVTKPG